MITVKRVLKDGTTMIESGREFVYWPANPERGPTYRLTDEDGGERSTTFDDHTAAVYVMNAAGATVETIRPY